MLTYSNGQRRASATGGAVAVPLVDIKINRSAIIRTVCIKGAIPLRLKQGTFFASSFVALGKIHVIPPLPFIKQIRWCTKSEIRT